MFTDQNYGGNCVTKGVGEYLNSASIGLPDNTISSVKIGSGASVRLCANDGLNSPCEFFHVNDDRLSYFDSMPDDATSSMKVEGNAPTTNCVPNEFQVAFFMNENWQETCILRGVGRYNDAGALGLPNDTISSVKVGARVWVRICDNVNNDSPCDQFEYDRSDLTATTVQNNKASSAEVFLKGGIGLCDNDLTDNNGGECRYFGAPDTGENLQNMSSHNFDNRIQSVRYDPGWEGRYHIVLYVDQNQTGALAHYDGSVNALQDPYRNGISSIKIYRNHPPTARLVSPANGTVLPGTTTGVPLAFAEGSQKRIKVWNGTNYDYMSGWATYDSQVIAGLTPGTYNWQVQSRDSAGEGPWSPVWTFSVNTPPTVASGVVTVEAGTSQTIQVPATDAEQTTLTLAASGLPSFATFVDNHDRTGILQLSPPASLTGTYLVTVSANDGDVTGAGTVSVQVTAPPAPAGYQAEYFNNRTLSGPPALVRSEATIDNDWGGGGPGNGVGNDNFSARWTRTVSVAAGTYRFTVTADDGVRLYVDDVLSIDRWVDQGATTYTVDKTLVAGNHTFRMEYYENGGGAVARFRYQEYSPPPAAPGISSGTTYRLVNPNSNKVLSVNGSGTANGTLVKLWSNNGSAGQKWLVTRNSDGTYKLTNPNSNKVLDVANAGAADGNNVQIYTDTDHAAQRWLITQNSDGTYKLTNPNSNKVLDIDGGASADGTKIQIWTDNGSAAQKWQFVADTPPPPGDGTELLPSAWNLAGTNGASEKYQTIPSNALAGKTTLRVTYDLHGLQALGGDASAIIFDQNGWKYVSLSNYGQNGLNGIQTVDIPLSAFGLDLNQGVGLLHTRFWYSSAFAVDIVSIKVV